MKRGKITLTILVFVCAHGFGQTAFKYKRPIEGVAAEGWYSLSLPADMFSSLNDDLGDIRLYSLAGDDTLELQYLLDVRSDKVSRETVNLPIFNQSTRGGVLFVTFEVPDSQKVNYIDLAFEQPNYFAFVSIEGSNDKSEWFEISKDHRIVSIKNGSNDYTLSAVSFPVSDYRFLRVAVTSDTPLTFRNASFQHQRVKRGQLRDVPLTWQMHTYKKSGLSYVDLKLRHYVPISSIIVKADTARDFYRDLTIEYVRDSTKTEKRWVRYYERVYGGHLTSFKPNQFTFDHVTAKELRLVIRDQDNAPISIHSVKAAGPDVVITAYLKPGNNFVLYGAGMMRAPSYDLAYFGNKITATPMTASFGAAEEIGDDEQDMRPLFENKLWLWSIMGLMIGGLGFFTIRMLRQQ